MSHEALERLHENLLRLKMCTAEEILDSVLKNGVCQQLATTDMLDV